MKPVGLPIALTHFLSLLCCLASVASKTSRRKHLDQQFQNRCRSCPVEPAQFFHETLTIYRSDLVQHNLSVLVLEVAGDACRIRPPLRGHRSDDHRSQPMVHFIRRDHQAGTLFLNLAADRWVEINQINVKPIDHHSHSFSSQVVELVGGSSTNRSSSFFRIRVNAADQPARAFFAERTTTAFGRTAKSTSPCKPVRSRIAAGMRTPCDLPIRMIRVRMIEPPD